VSLGFAIVGTGMVARYHAQAIRSTAGTRLVGVCRADVARKAHAEAELGAPCETSYEAVLARPDVDAVCLCTPSGLHAIQAVQAARAGKHVLVEKPMALTLEDAESMIRACASAGVRLGVVLQRRADPSFQAVRASITAGALGTPVLGTATVPYLRGQSYYDSAAWRGTWAQDGGGALMNQGIHVVDLLLWLMGDVSEVSARTATLAHEIEVEDCATATLRFASGALGSLAATTAAAPGFPHRVEVYGSRSGIQIEGETVMRPGEARHDPASAGAGASPTGISVIGHTRILDDFAAAVREGRAPLVPGEEGRRSLALVLAVYESARTGRAVRLS
jgi:UDP-N-acetyl-2-amino-2-deoxyglucuronate dehydrogenase